MTIRDDFDIKTTKETLTRVRDEQRALAKAEKERHASGQTTTSRGAYDAASRAVAADFLLRTCEAGPEAYAQALEATYKWCYGALGATALQKLPRDKTKPFKLPESLQLLFDAALNDPANIMVELPTKASHIAGLDDHNAITRGRIPVISDLRDRVTGDNIRRRSVPEVVRQIAGIVAAHENGINTDTHAHSFHFGQ